MKEKVNHSLYEVFKSKDERFSSLATEGKLLSMSVWENEESVK